MNGLYVVSGEPLAENADYRDPAADRRAKVDIDPGLGSRVEYLAPILGKELLVGRDDALSGLEGVQDELARNAGSADGLDNDANFLVGDNCPCICRKGLRRNCDSPIGRDVEIRHLAKDDIDAKPPRHHLAMPQKPVRDACAHGAEPKNAYSYLLHVLRSLILLNKDVLYLKTASQIKASALQERLAAPFERGHAQGNAL